MSVTTSLGVHKDNKGSLADSITGRQGPLKGRLLRLRHQISSLILSSVSRTIRVRDPRGEGGGGDHVVLVRELTAFQVPASSGETAIMSNPQPAVCNIHSISGASFMSKLSK